MTVKEWTAAMLLHECFFISSLLVVRLSHISYLCYWWLLVWMDCWNVVYCSVILSCFHWCMMTWIYYLLKTELVKCKPHSLFLQIANYDKIWIRSIKWELEICFDYQVFNCKQTVDVLDYWFYCIDMISWAKINFLLCLVFICSILVFVFFGFSTRIEKLDVHKAGFSVCAVGTW